MFGLLASLRRHKRLLLGLVSRDLRGRYVGSSMGLFWSVIYPLLNLAVYVFVFSIVLKQRWDPNQSKVEVALLMLCGIVVWHGFAEALSRITNSLVDNQNLIQKVVFPSEVLPAYLTISSLVNMLIGATVTVGAVAWFAYVSPPDPPTGALPARPIGLSVSLLALPVLMGLQAMFTLGLGYFLAALNLFVRDVYHVMGVALVVWMFMTPIFYPHRLVAEADMTWVLQVNPMHWLIDNYRRVLVYGLWPGPHAVAAFALVALILFAIGTAFFRAHKPRFPDLL